MTKIIEILLQYNNLVKLDMRQNALFVLFDEKNNFSEHTIHETRVSLSDFRGSRPSHIAIHATEDRRKSSPHSRTAQRSENNHVNVVPEFFSRFMNVMPAKIARNKKEKP